MRRVIIVGMAGPYEDELQPGDEIWGVNRIYKRQSNLSRLYFLDKLEDFDEEFTRDVDALGIPVYTQKVYPEIKQSISYPKEKATEISIAGYFTSTIAWVIAHAILEAVDAIHLHRILPFPLHGDYEDQKPCIEMWYGMAEGMGIKMTRSMDSSIGRPLDWQCRFYGYTDMSEFRNIKLLHQAGFKPLVKRGSISIPIHWPGMLEKS